MEREIAAVTGKSSAVGPVRWACLSGSGAGPRIALELSFSRRKPAFFSRRNDRRRDVTGRCITLPRIRVAVAFHPGVHALFRVHPGWCWQPLYLDSTVSGSREKGMAPTTYSSPTRAATTETIIG